LALAAPLTLQLLLGGGFQGVQKGEKRDTGRMNNHFLLGMYRLLL
jgi:hypothetical protein